MRLPEIDKWLDSVLDLERYSGADPSRNGIQVENDGSDISRAAFAVDASLETILRASEAGAGVLIVHHGLFWRDPVVVTGAHYRRIKALLDANLALYAAHLPLDAHPEVGNNAGIAARLGLIDLESFGEWRGVRIGYKGVFATPVSIDEAVRRLFPDGSKPLSILPFGPREIRSAAVVSGGATDEVHQAIAEGCDLFITGDVSHEIYHACLEQGISVISGGHYQTETVGVKLLAERLGRETALDTVFIDVPTGL